MDFEPLPSSIFNLQPRGKSLLCYFRQLGQTSRFLWEILAATWQTIEVCHHRNGWQHTIWSRYAKTFAFESWELKVVSFNAIRRHCLVWQLAWRVNYPERRYSPVSLQSSVRTHPPCPARFATCFARIHIVQCDDSCITCSCKKFRGRRKGYATDWLHETGQ